MTLRSPRRRSAGGCWLAAAVVGLVVGCQRDAREPQPAAAEPSQPVDAAELEAAKKAKAAKEAKEAKDASDAKAAKNGKPSEPMTAPPGTTILALPESAYGTSLHLSQDTTYLLTLESVYRLLVGLDAEDMEPPRTMPLGSAAIVHGDEILYWADGALRAAKLDGGRSRVVAKVPSEVREIAAGDAGIAWLRGDEQGGFLVEARDESEPIYRSPQRLTSLTAVDDGVVVVRSGDSGYRLVRISMDGKAVTESEPFVSRTPSMVVAHHGSLYYYDGPARGVRRVRADFREDQHISKDTICSPLTVGAHVFCAQLGGVYSIDESTGATRPLASETNGPITAIAATDDRVVWVVDAGKKGLLVKSTSLTDP